MKWIVLIAAGVVAFTLVSDRASAAYVPTVLDSQVPEDRQVAESDGEVLLVGYRHRVRRSHVHARVYTRPRYVYPRTSYHHVHRYAYPYVGYGYGVYVAPYSGIGVQVYRGPSSFYYHGW